MAPRNLVRAPRRYAGSVWGLVPFFLFSLLFLLAPSVSLLIGAFQTPDGDFTLANLVALTEPAIVNAFGISLRISAASALIGGVLGTVLAWATVMGALPAGLRTGINTFCGVASNFAGVPLAFAFLATLGRVGLVTALLRGVGIDLYASGFNLLSFWGLTLTYLYFQIPLMLLVITPALEGLRREWREACACLGGTAWHYWRWIALPVLFPPILGAMLLLFANAFGAVATAYALTGSSLNIVPILLFAQIRGDVLHNPNLGYALALGMIVITGLCNLAYMGLRMRTQKGRA